MPVIIDVNVAGRTNPSVDSFFPFGAVATIASDTAGSPIIAIGYSPCVNMNDPLDGLASVTFDKISAENTFCSPKGINAREINPVSNSGTTYFLIELMLFKLLIKMDIFSTPNATYGQATTNKTAKGSIKIIVISTGNLLPDITENTPPISMV